MGGNAINFRKSNTAHAQTLLDRIGQGLHDMLGGKPPDRGGKGKRTSANTGGKNSAVSSKTKPGADKPKSGSSSAPQPVQVIQKFTSKSFQSEQRMGGLYKSRDNTHQVVQQYDPNYVNKSTGQKTGAWQVHIQPVESGRINPNQHSFTSNRAVTVKDFNDPNSKLVSNSIRAQNRLNHDSNRLPETPAPAAAKKPDERKLSTGDWAKQQAANLAGGISSSFTSTVGLVTSLPEAAGKFAGSAGDLGKAVTNRVTGGNVFKTAVNPIVYERQSAARDSKPLTEQIASRVQAKIDSSIGADPQSPTYQFTAAVAPLLVIKKGGGKTAPGGSTGKLPSGSGRMPGGGNWPKPPSHPVAGLRNAVQLYKEGKINSAALNEAMSKANSAFQAQKGANTSSWSKEMFKDYVSHNVEANRALGGG